MMVATTYIPPFLAPHEQAAYLCEMGDAVLAGVQSSSIYAAVRVVSHVAARMWAEQQGRCVPIVPVCCFDALRPLGALLPDNG